jgi:hypothetical protein
MFCANDGAKTHNSTLGNQFSYGAFLTGTVIGHDGIQFLLQMKNILIFLEMYVIP